MTLPFRRIYSSVEYCTARTAALSSGKIPHGFIDTPEAAYIAVNNYIIYLSYDNTCGALVKMHDGVIEPSGLFNVGYPGQGEELFRYLVDRWDVNYLNAFEGPLTKLYAKYGFKETGRYPFDPELAHTDWDYETYGTPDLIIMERL